MEEEALIKYEELLRRREISLELCRKLLRELESNKDDADTFFGGEMRKLYVEVTDMAKTKIKGIQTKITNL